MRHIGNFVAYLILIGNILLVCFLLLSAYSPLINPETYPNLSCLGLIFPVFLFFNIGFVIFWLFIKRRYILLSLLGLILCFGQIRTYIPFNFRTKLQDIPENRIKLLSYNVMAFDEYRKHTSDAPNPIIQYILRSKADIVCMQEFMFSNDKRYLTKEEIDGAFKDYPYQNIVKIGDGDASTNHLACYSKYPIISAKKLKYGSSYNGSVAYELVIRGDTVTLINNHLESNKLTKKDKVVYEQIIKDPQAKEVSNGVKQLVNKLAEASAIRSNQARVIADEIASSRHSAIIVCGDFNDTPISYTHRIIARNLDDAFTQSGRGLGISYNQNRFYFRIDNILISNNLKSYNCTVDRRIKESDHYPIWCYIAKRK